MGSKRRQAVHAQAGAPVEIDLFEMYATVTHLADLFAGEGGAVQAIGLMLSGAAEQLGDASSDLDNVGISVKFQFSESQTGKRQIVAVIKRDTDDNG